MKNTFYYIVFALTISSFTFAQDGVGIGTTTPDDSALLQLESTTQGFLPPRMNKSEMATIPNPSEGLIVYCTDCSPIGLYSYNGSSFVSYVKVLGTVSTINCAGFTTTGDISTTANFENVLVNVPYIGGNGGYYPTIVAHSTGVTGLSIIAPNAFFNNGDGTLYFSVSGTPSGVGIASFTVTFGGVSCGFDLKVTPPTVTTPTGRVWMDRNLGATQVATSRTDTNSYGDLYQWGRNTNGHEIRTSPTVAGPVAIGSEGTSFITNSTDPFSWMSTVVNDRWNLGTEANPIKNVSFDPCPEGFRVPTQTEWETEFLYFPNLGRDGAFESVLKLPSAGYRDYDGVLTAVDNRGFYFTSTPSSPTNNRSVAVYFTPTETLVSIFGQRARGFSIRCIQQLPGE